MSPYATNLRQHQVINNDTYSIFDVRAGSWTVSETVLRPNKSTRGHKHNGQDELYVFKSIAKMEVDNTTFLVEPGSVVFVPAGAFHKIVNDRDSYISFLAFFTGDAQRPKL